MEISDKTVTDTAAMIAIEFKIARFKDSWHNQEDC